MASVWRRCGLRTEAPGDVEARDDDDPVEEAALDDLELAQRCRERMNGGRACDNMLDDQWRVS